MQTQPSARQQLKQPQNGQQRWRWAASVKNKPHTQAPQRSPTRSTSSNNVHNRNIVVNNQHQQGQPRLRSSGKGNAINGTEVKSKKPLHSFLKSMKVRKRSNDSNKSHNSAGSNTPTIPMFHRPSIPMNHRMSQGTTSTSTGQQSANPFPGAGSVRRNPLRSNSSSSIRQNSVPTAVQHSTRQTLHGRVPTPRSVSQPELRTPAYINWAAPNPNGGGMFHVSSPVQTNHSSNATSPVQTQQSSISRVVKNKQTATPPPRLHRSIPSQPDNNNDNDDDDDDDDDDNDDDDDDDEEEEEDFETSAKLFQQHNQQQQQHHHHQSQQQQQLQQQQQQQQKLQQQQQQQQHQLEEQQRLERHRARQKLLLQEKQEQQRAEQKKQRRLKEQQERQRLQEEQAQQQQQEEDEQEQYLHRQRQKQRANARIEKKRLQSLKGRPMSSITSDNVDAQSDTISTSLALALARAEDAAKVYDLTTHKSQLNGDQGSDSEIPSWRLEEIAARQAEEDDLYDARSKIGKRHQMKKRKSSEAVNAALMFINEIENLEDDIVKLGEHVSQTQSEEGGFGFSSQMEEFGGFDEVTHVEEKKTAPKIISAESYAGFDDGGFEGEIDVDDDGVFAGFDDDGYVV